MKQSNTKHKETENNVRNTKTIKKMEADTMKTNTNIKYENGFSDLIRNFENAKSGSIDEAQAVSVLGKAVVYSVIKKCLSVGTANTSENYVSKQSNNSYGGKKLIELKDSIYITDKNNERLKYALNNETKKKIDKNGKIKHEVVDRTLHKAINKLINQTIGDGYDLVQTAILELLEQKRHQIANNQQINMERVYIKKVAKKTHIKSINYDTLWSEVKTLPIKEVFSIVRREIYENGKIQNALASMYVYAEKEIENIETGDVETVYIRGHKYADIGGREKTFDDCFLTNSTTYTENTDDIENVQKIILALGLTSKQNRILTLRMQGLGYKAIAERLDIKRDSVRSALKEIQKKCEKIGFTPSMR